MHPQVGEGDPGRGEVTSVAATEAERLWGPSGSRTSGTGGKAAPCPAEPSPRPGFECRFRRPYLGHFEDLFIWPGPQFSNQENGRGTQRRGLHGD